MNIFKWFKREKKIAFIDGDQALTGLLEAYDKYVKGTGTETHLIRMIINGHREPKQLRPIQGINKIYLENLTKGKEVVDKFIGAYIQRAVSEGYTHITVISSDYDFIDIFKMAMVVDERASKVTFRMIVPNPQGRMVNAPDKDMNIEIIKKEKP